MIVRIAPNPGRKIFRLYLANPPTLFDKIFVLRYHIALRDRALQQTDRIEFIFRLPSMIPNRLIN